MDNAVLHDCLTQAFAGQMTFPETVGRMIETGVERYDADPTRMLKTHYAADGTTHTEVIPLPDPIDGALAEPGDGPRPGTDPDQTPRESRLVRAVDQFTLRRRELFRALDEHFGINGDRLDPVRPAPVSDGALGSRGPERDDRS